MKKSLSNLLRNLEKSQTPSSEANISSLNDALSKTLIKGGYDVTNMACCGQSNSSCHNVVCCLVGPNMSCHNETCT